LDNLALLGDSNNNLLLVNHDSGDALTQDYDEEGEED
jgi:YD repeat-containing protein